METFTLENTLKEMDLIDIHKTFHSKKPNTRSFQVYTKYSTKDRSRLSPQNKS